MMRFVRNKGEQVGEIAINFDRRRLRPSERTEKVR